VPSSDNLTRSFRAKIRENLPVAKGHFLLALTPLADAPEPKPGQFYMASVGRGFDPLLKRPFSLFSRTADGLRFLFRVRGRGTELMSGLKPGEVINLIGPLGTPYPRPKAGQVPIIVAGGIAIAAVHYLAESLKKKATVLYGARNREELLMLESVEAAAGRLRTSTEDGSYGIKGTVIDLLREVPAGDNSVLYACGPRGMLEAVAETARERGLRGYVSMEENMACGMGACLGCVVITKGGYKRVCKEGPVFKIEDVLWETMEPEATDQRPHDPRAYPVRR
jgi:dihydroorotate dehydrogenase electron transfer subunit